MVDGKKQSSIPHPLILIYTLMESMWGKRRIKNI